MTDPWSDSLANEAEDVGNSIRARQLHRIPEPPVYAEEVKQWFDDLLVGFAYLIAGVGVLMGLLFLIAMAITYL